MRNAAKKLIVLMLAILLLLSACGTAERSAPEGELADVLGGGTTGTELKERAAADQIFTLNYDPDGGMNPINGGSPVNMLLWSLLYDSVFIVDENFEVSSELVTEVKSDDYLWWVFTVDNTVLFSDGTPVTAKDIVYSIQRAQQTSYYGKRLSVIYGISAMSDDCFAITTAYANSQLPALLNIPVVKKDTYFDPVPVGSGPYHMAESGDRLVLTEGHRHESEMPVKTVYLKDYTDTSARIQAFEDATLDLVTNDPTGMYNLGYGSSDTRYYDTSNLHYVGFNMDSKYFGTNAARKAVSYVIDRDYVVDDLLSGCGVASAMVVHPKTPYYEPGYAAGWTYDPEKALTMFETAGVEDLDRDGELEMLVTGIVVELKIKFIVNNDSTAKVMAARRITEELNALGITTTLWELSWTDYIEALETGDYDLYYGEIRMTPDWNLSELFLPRETKKNEDEEFTGINYGNIRDSRYTELYETYLAAPDDQTRMAALSEVCHYIGDNTAIIPVCFERREVLTHRGVCTGISATQYDVFNKFYEWKIDLK